MAVVPESAGAADLERRFGTAGEMEQALRQGLWLAPIAADAPPRARGTGRVAWLIALGAAILGATVWGVARVARRR